MSLGRGEAESRKQEAGFRVEFKAFLVFRSVGQINTQKIVEENAIQQIELKNFDLE